MTDELNPAAFEADPVAYLQALGMTDVRQLPTGEWVGIQRMLTTFGLMVGLDWMGYRTRFCYETAAAARAALADWDGAGWPPGYWVKQKPEDLKNPNRPGRCKIGDKCSCTPGPRQVQCPMWAYV